MTKGTESTTPPKKGEEETKMSITNTQAIPIQNLSYVYPYAPPPGYYPIMIPMNPLIQQQQLVQQQQREEEEEKQKPKIKILLPKISSEYKIVRMLTAFNVEMEEQEEEYEKASVFMFSICPKSRKVLVLLQPVKENGQHFGGFTEKRQHHHLDSISCASEVLKQKRIKNYLEKAKETKKKILQLLAEGYTKEEQAAGSHLHNQRYLKELFEAKEEKKAITALDHILRGPYRSRHLYVKKRKELIYFVPMPYFSPPQTKKGGPTWVVLKQIIGGIQLATEEEATRNRSNSSSSTASSITELSDYEFDTDILATADRIQLDTLFTDKACAKDILDILNDIQKSNELAKPTSS
mmetsp:Transcript_13233/g.19966  ORF Transcript_13233/g.19966 Transcript_13233/m.19966 type:complete len:351 (+) Transcript_13233:197-1249(+)